MTNSNSNSNSTGNSDQESFASSANNIDSENEYRNAATPVPYFPFFDLFPFASNVFWDTRDMFGIRLPFASLADVDSTLLHNGRIWEPPYARLLRRLGLFDPIETPRHTAYEKGSTFPVIVHSANPLQSNGNSSRQFEENRSDRLQPDSADTLTEALSRDGSRIIGTISEVFGETTRWAVGNLFGQLRNAMEHVESRIHHPEKEEEPQQRDGYPQKQQRENQEASPFYRALQNDLITNFDKLFPEPSEEEKSNYSYYYVTTRTMPDGSIESRKVIRNSDGLEKTTITSHYPESPEKDETITCTNTPKGLLQEPGLKENNKDCE
ncbi:hypothetical protein BX070DRAFT_224167 [Coemansia spiralis]|nr:hypothetical protein BX070DRAFT_224167 [Coemansia spiralis]